MSKTLFFFCTKSYLKPKFVGKLQLPKAYATHIGNPYHRSENICEGLPEKWKKLWFLSMKRKAEIEGEDVPIPRSNHRNWSYKAEINAFQLRLGISCSEELLKVAFCDSMPSQEENQEINDNQELTSHGRRFLEMFLAQYISIAFPLVPSPAKLAIQEYLLSSSTLAHVAVNLGYQDFLQTLEFPPNEVAVGNCFLAVLEVINICEGPVSAGRFALDFVIPSLNGKDILDDLWKPKDAMSLLCEEMKKRSKALPEVRLVRQSGINTVLPVFNIAVFSGKELLAESGGESIPLAEEDAAKIALKKIYNIHNNSAPIPMGVNVNNDFLSQLFNPLMASAKEESNSHDHNKISASSS